LSLSVLWMLSAETRNLHFLKTSVTTSATIPGKIPRCSYQKICKSVWKGQLNVASSYSLRIVSWNLYSFVLRFSVDNTHYLDECFFISHTKPMDSKAAWRSSVMQCCLFSNLFLYWRRCLFTQIASWWLGSYREGTLQWPNTSRNCFNSSSLSLHIAAWESQMKPTWSRARMRSSVMVDRCPFCLSLNWYRCRFVHCASDGFSGYKLGTKQCPFSLRNSRSSSVNHYI